MRGKQQNRVGICSEGKSGNSKKKADWVPEGGAGATGACVVTGARMEEETPGRECAVEEGSVLSRQDSK